MRVIVTGSSGLLGRHVVEALTAAGHRMLGIDSTAPARTLGEDQVTADLTDRGAAFELIRDADAVVHAAAIPRPTGRTAGEVFSTNVGMTHAVVEATVRAAIPRLVYVSSFSVLGFPFFERPVAPSAFPIDERQAAAPQDAYALSKWLGEEIVDAAVRRSDLAAVSLRMPWIQTPDAFQAAVGQRRRIAQDAARDLWSYIDARDAADAVRLAAEQARHGHVRLFVSAADTYSEEPTEALLAAGYPGVPRRTIAGHGCVFDMTAALDRLGFAPRHSWRDYPEEAQS